jgi:uncharacterized membrane protein YoaK (UPF0700 family)
MQSDAAQTDSWQSLGLAFVGGYGDAAGFVLAKTFTGRVTGNLVLMAIGVASCDRRAVFGHLLAVVTFLFGIFLSALIARPMKAWSPWQLLPVVMGIEVILFGAACLLLESHAIYRVEEFVICVSLALGMQNGAFRRAGGVSVHTTYLTGMITRFITAETDRFASRTAPQTPAVPYPQINILGRIWLAFVLGAGIGAAMVLQFRGFGLLGAGLILLAIIVRSSLFKLPRQAIG